MSTSTQPPSTQSPPLQKRLIQWFIRGSQVVKNLLIRPLTLVFSPLHRFLLKLNTRRFRHTASPSIPPAQLSASASHRGVNIFSRSLHTLIRIPKPFRRMSTLTNPQASCPDLSPYIDESTYNQPPMTSMIVYPSCSKIPTRTNAKLTRNPLATIRQHVLDLLPFQQKSKRSLGVAYPPLPVSLLPYCVSIRLSPNTGFQPWNNQFLFNPKDILEIRAVHCEQPYLPYSQNQAEYYFTLHNASLVVYSGNGSAEKKTSGRNYPIVIRLPQKGVYGLSIIELFSLLVSSYFVIKAVNKLFAHIARKNKKQNQNQILSPKTSSPSSVAQLSLQGSDSNAECSEKDHPSEKYNTSTNDQLSRSSSDSDNLKHNKGNSHLTTAAEQYPTSTSRLSEIMQPTAAMVNSSLNIDDSITDQQSSSPFSALPAKDKATDTGTEDETLSAEHHHSKKIAGHNSEREDIQAEGKQASDSKQDDTLVGAASIGSDKQHNTSTHSNDNESKELGNITSKTSQSHQIRDSEQALPAEIVISIEDDDEMSEVSDESFYDNPKNHDNSALADSSQPAITHIDLHPTRDSLSDIHAKNNPHALIPQNLHFSQSAPNDANSVSTGSDSEDNTSKYDSTRNHTLSQSSKPSSSNPHSIIHTNLRFTQCVRDDANSVSTESGSEDDTNDYDDPTRSHSHNTHSQSSESFSNNPHGIIHTNLHFAQYVRDDANSVSTESGSEDETNEYDEPTVIFTQGHS